jgi:hypothetical protein
MPTHPGVNALFDLTAFPLGERQVIMRLSRHFYITRAAKSTQVGNSEYRSFLMRPTEGMSAVLNVEREIVVLFADYETFEARTLQAFDLTCDQFDDVRVDRSLRFLIARDANIERSIRHYLLQDPEYPVVIPFKYADFQSPNEEFIFNTIRRNYLIRDLFGYQSPLKQEYYFFGRKQLVDSVIDRHKSGQNSGLFGLRKSGKTSTIYAIQRRARSSGSRTLIIDCQDPAIHARRYASLLQYIIIEVRRELGLKKIEINLGAMPDQVSEAFRGQLNDALSAAGSDILLIFDEIENISPQTTASRHWREEDDTLLFWQTARSFFQSPRKHRITFCFVGTNPSLFELPKIHGIDNPVYLFAPKTFIPMLSLPETSEMITRLGYFMGLDFAPSVISFIHQRFGGHPFFVRQLCSQIHKRVTTSRPRSVSIAGCKEAEQDAGADIQRYMGEILATLKTFYPAEYDMIEYLAAGEVDSFHDLAEYDAAYVEHLVGYGFVVRRGDDFEFAFESIAEATKKSLAKPSPGLADRWGEINKRRNRIEEEIRGALYQWAMRLTSTEWNESVRTCLTAKRFDQVGALTRQEAFSRNNSQLYFLELLKFIEHSGQYGSAETSIGNISGALHLVNKYRVDAHAKEIDDSSYSELANALNVLETIFVPPP